VHRDERSGSVQPTTTIGKKVWGSLSFGIEINGMNTCSGPGLAVGEGIVPGMVPGIVPGNVAVGSTVGHGVVVVGARVAVGWPVGSGVDVAVAAGVCIGGLFVINTEPSINVPGTALPLGELKLGLGKREKSTGAVIGPSAVGVHIDVNRIVSTVESGKVAMGGE
jgi:hypothetical protein